MRVITESIAIVWVTTLVVALSGCNNRSPETSPDPAEVEPSEEAPAEPTKPEEPPRPDPLPTLEGPHRTAFDLLDNRPLAHVLDDDVVVIRAGEPDFVRYVHGDHPGHWALEAEVDGRRAARLDRRRDSTIWIPAKATGAATIELEVFNPASGDNNLTLEVNDKELESKALEKGWQRVRWNIPADALKLENSVDLTFSNLGRIAGDLSGGAISRVRIGELEELAEAPTAEASPAEASNDAGAADAATKAAAEEAVDGAADNARARADAVGAWIPGAQGPLTLQPGDGAFWFVAGLGDAHLSFEIEADTGCGIATTIEREGGARPVEAKLHLIDTHGERQSGVVPFEVPRGEVARLTVEHDGECDDVTLHAAGVAIPGAAPERPEFEPPKRVLIWMIDTLRSDYLPVHFETDVEAPNLARLASEGASFKWAYVQGNESRTSHASLFSGMFPSKHRVLGRGHLKPYHELLPEALQKGDYETGAYISNGYVSKPWGFVQGWNSYRNNLREGYGIHGEALAEDGLEWAKTRTEVPFFLYLGTIDPHVTYRRHEELIEKYDPEPYRGRFEKYCLGTDLGKIKGGGLKVTARDKARIIALYKNEITFNDQAFGKLRAGMEELGIWEDTLVIVTSDHGDEFWEHGSVGHGHNIYGELVHVPIIVYYPKAVPAGRRLESGADVLDVYPTILDLAGLDPVDDVQGRSLLPQILERWGDYPDPAIATQYLLHYAMQLGRWKLYLRKGSYEVFDRENDLLEQTDVAEKHPFASRQLLDAMGWFRTHRDRWDKKSWGTASNLSAEFLARMESSRSGDE